MMTRSLSLIGTALLALLATACDDDSGNNASCGDGHITVGENCDDGNTTNGDGCSSQCRSEGMCGNGVFDVSTEECDDGNTMSGDGCSSSCDKEGECGNGQVEPGETCDDSNTVSMDGCSSTCQMETGGGRTCGSPGVITLAAMGTDMVGTVTGDTTGAMDGLPAADCDGDVAGEGVDNIWTFTLAETRDVIVLLTPDSSWDGGIRVMTVACDATMELVDVAGDDGCSDSGGNGDIEGLGYVNLPAGTYYVSVDGYTASDAGAYELSVTASEPGCGNGAIGNLEWCDDGNDDPNDGCSPNCTVEDGYNCDTSEPSICQMEGCGDGIIQDTLNETCDDDNTDPNDGCDANCLVETGWTCEDEPSVCREIECNNGLVEPGEECDDGNMADGDRCTALCVLEQDVTEAEPNDIEAQAQVLNPVSQIVRGSYGAGEVDLYKFTLTATAKVEIETYATIDGLLTNYDGVGNAAFDCPDFSIDDTEVAVFLPGKDLTDSAMAMAIDDDDGDQYCSYLGAADSDEDDNDTADPTQLAMLPAGTYIIRVQPSELSFGIPANTRYMLDLKITPMNGAPVAPAAGDLKINEFFAADGGTTNGGLDSNCDGSLDQSDDEFIELVNVSNKTLDLTGVTYSDSAKVWFTFAAQPTGNLTLAPGKAVVIWGGGMPACPGVDNFFTNGGSHTLSLNDAGDTIKIATGGATPVTIATATYDASLAPTTNRKSANLNPDLTGTAYVLHTAVPNAVGNFSPGKKSDGTAFQ